MATYILRGQTVRLKHFTPAEFGIWWPLMDRELLLTLDAYREILGYPVNISPVTGAIGRPDKPTSQHFPNPFVKAVDTTSPAPLVEQRDAAIRAGFTGIGLYREWKPNPGAHLDVRRDRKAGNPATWSGVKIAGENVYTGIEAALA